MQEFTWIKQYLTAKTVSDPNVLLGIGDDAAIIKVPTGFELAMSLDTLVAGVHFPRHAVAYDIGCRALAVNLSDMAAMGATPRWVTLSLTVPEFEENWLSEFSRGFFTEFPKYNLHLIGGDSCSGPLSISIQIHGLLPQGTALLRSGAKVGDLVYISGALGGAGAALSVVLGEVDVSADLNKACQEIFYRPAPQVALGQALQGIASSCIDISDGLLADLQHVLAASNVGARLDIPNSIIHSLVFQLGHSEDQAVELALTAGDDYQLCFTVPKAQQARLAQLAKSPEISCTCIGEITQSTQLQIYYQQHALEFSKHGYQHK